MEDKGTARRRRAEQGFTLIELMVVIAIIGILAALLIPRVVQSAHLARVNATMADLRTAGHAWLLDSLRNNRDNADPVIGDLVGPCPRVLVLAEAQSLIGSTAKATDQFGNPLEYRVDQFPNPNMLMIRSANADGQFQNDYTFGTTFSADDHVQDIVWFETGFAQRPAG
jgi:prepilin-type N-terminal cleavage/methylation domain-containing protein